MLINQTSLLNWLFEIAGDSDFSTADSLTNMTPWKGKRLPNISKHHFSGANSMLNFGEILYIYIFFFRLPQGKGGAPREKERLYGPLQVADKQRGKTMISKQRCLQLRNHREKCRTKLRLFRRETVLRCVTLPPTAHAICKDWRAKRLNLVFF